MATVGQIDSYKENVRGYFKIIKAVIIKRFKKQEKLNNFKNMQIIPKKNH